MQLADNTALAEALESGQTQEYGFSLKFDWDRDGQYANKYSDFSDLIIDATLDAQFTGQYPAEMEVNDGYAQRQLTVTVSGSVGGMNVVALFSPFSGSPLGQIGAMNTPCVFDVTVMTDDGPVDIRQFTGYVLSAQPSRKDGTVSLTLGDITSQLTAEAKIMPIAQPQPLAQYTNWSTALNGDTTNRGGTSLAWFMIHLLRQNGMFQGPKPPENCLAYFTLCGGVLPEVGTINQQFRDGRHCVPIAAPSAKDAYGNAIVMPAFWQSVWNMPTYDTKYVDTANSYISLNSPPSWDGTQDGTIVLYSAANTGSFYATMFDTPSVDPLTMWDKGPYGPCMVRGIYTSDSNIGVSSQDSLYFAGSTSEPYNPSPSNTNLRNRLYGGGWHLIENGAGQVAATQFTVYLNGVEAYFSSPTYPSPYPTTPYNANSGPSQSPQYLWPSDNGHMVQVDFGVINEGTYQIDLYSYRGHPMNAGQQTVYSWTATGKKNLSEGWHYIGMCVELQQSGVPKLYLNVDGAVEQVTLGYSDGTLNTTDMGHYAVVVDENGNNVTVEDTYFRFQSYGGAQHWGLWYQNDVTPTSSTVWSNQGDCMDYDVRTDISPSASRAMWAPDVRGKETWDVLKEIGSADLGVIFTDEYGKVYYRNWTEIEAAKDKANVTSQLTLDDVQDVDPYTTFDSVKNAISFSWKKKYFVDDCVFEASKVDQFASSNGLRYKFQVSADDAMSVLPGELAPRRLAQGYWAPTYGAFDNANTWQNDGKGTFYVDANGKFLVDKARAYTFQDFMSTYAPGTWLNGFESHNAGDKNNAGQPLEGLGPRVWVRIGWEDGDDDPRNITIYVKDDHGPGSRTTWYAVDDTTPFLRIRGNKIVDGDSGTEIVLTKDDTSLARYGQRLYERSSGDWASDYKTQKVLSQKLADDLAQPRPVFETLDVQGDPGRQLQDMIEIIDSPITVVGQPRPEWDGAFGGPIYASVVGINRKFSSSGITETLTLRTILNKGGAWELDSPNFSQLDYSTILG